MVEQQVASPCVNNCQLNHEDVCQGCYRSIAEIVAWMELSNDQRRDVLRRCRERRIDDGMLL